MTIQRGSAGSLQWRSFRENPTNYHIFIVRDVSFAERINLLQASFGTTDRQAGELSYPCCACTPRVTNH